ncbi:hypothetical protein FHY31_002898 [Xanthomonas euvesicatoria]|uniref:Uncharacterized protein n=1 Tax=Xanthomonas euvesicatoria TaxID=456327 RepID=A0AAW3U795_XANEU|nr:hypothetical protein [Xanthomonas euvesicatoria]MBB4871122.1 hypothetical protein [Xanthomonas euvesicatoria]
MHDLDARMPESVAMTGRHQRQACAGRGDETGLRAVGAAVVRHDHQVGTQIRGAPAQQAALDDFANIARQQCARRRGLDPQHAAGLIA